MASATLDSGVLVLNRFFQAVQVTSVKRAFSLFYKGYVKAVDEDFLTYNFNDWRDLPPNGDSIRTPSFELRIPRVIQLVYYERPPRFRVRFSRKNIFMRDEYRCQYCGQHFDPKELTLDHIIPTSRGGKNSWENVVCCCVECNKRKGNRTPEERGMRLFRKAKRPLWIPFSRFAKKYDSYPIWRTFVDYAYWNVPLDEDED
jgi:5-methylcytosine-specific restriction endonuclease McrA